MIVYRLARSKYSLDISGKGAELAGGRWNTAGTKMLYTCSSKALCLVEVLVHINANIIPTDYRILTLTIEEPFEMEVVAIASLLGYWKKMPWSLQTQEIGDAFIQKNSALVLKVPSAVVEGDYNYLLNTHHPDYHKVKISSHHPFEFDSRLFKIENFR